MNMTNRLTEIVRDRGFHNLLAPRSQLRALSSQLLALSSQLLALSSLLFALSSHAGAAFVYDGALLNKDGLPQHTDQAPLTATVRVYDGPGDGTELLWERETKVLTDKTGTFHILVHDGLGKDTGNGTGKTLDVLLREYVSGSLYVTLQIAGAASEITPRQRIATVPYALHAADALGSPGDFDARRALKVREGVKVANNAQFAPTYGITVQKGLEAIGGMDANAVSASGYGLFYGPTSVGEGVSGAMLGVARSTTVDNTSTVESLDVTRGDLLVNGCSPLVKKGMIALWYGSADAVPAGWAICDGIDGRPNLVKRFPVGAGTTKSAAGGTAGDGGEPYALGATGGQEKVRLSTDQMPKHTHTVPFVQMRKVLQSDDSEHEGLAQAGGEASGGESAGDRRSTAAGGNGDGAAEHENMPSYRALYYIMYMIDTEG